MINITFLGTCSGTEPMPNRHHSSVIMEINGKYYWFDAGENCSYSARDVKKLYFTHHGREILRDVSAAERLISTYGIDAVICHDGYSVTV